jgi:hypothetical protein
MKRSTKPPKKRGRPPLIPEDAPPLIPEDAPPLTVSTIKWYTFRMATAGHSAAAIAHAFKRVFGERRLASERVR